MYSVNGPRRVIMEKVKEILLEHSLCDRCLGRLFASYGLGLSNALRGRALKTALAMQIHKEIMEGNTEEIEHLRKIAENGGRVFDELARRYVGYVTHKKCEICNGHLDSLLGKLALRAYNELSKYEGKSFLVGVKKGSQIALKERRIAELYGLTSWESVAREVKREVGKRLQSLTDMNPDFRYPDLIIVIDLDLRKVFVEPTPLHLLGSYVKLGRFITQMLWIGKKGRNYSFSVEESVRKILPLFKGEDLLFHASGREDADARMLGDGRPLILEVKRPVKRSVKFSKIEEKASSPPWVLLKIDKVVKPEYVRRIKSDVKRKIYRAIVISYDGFDEEDIYKIKESFSNRVISQKTPRRVLRRRKDIVRFRKVYEVDGMLLHKNIAEFIIHCDGGLYVKELIHGDEGRTTPSFAEMLNKALEVAFLDVLKHEEFEVASTS